MWRIQGTWRRSFQGSLSTKKAVSIPAMIGIRDRMLKIRMRSPSQ